MSFKKAMHVRRERGDIGVNLSVPNETTEGKFMHCRWTEKTQEKHRNSRTACGLPGPSWAQCSHYREAFNTTTYVKETNVIETDRTRSLWPDKKRSFFLVFRKFTYSPNIWQRFVVELSKVKEPSTTDSFLFVSKFNVRLNFLFFWRSFVSQSFKYSLKMERSWVRITLHFLRHFP